MSKDQTRKENVPHPHGSGGFLIFEQRKSVECLREKILTMVKKKYEYKRFFYRLVKL